MIIRCPKCQKSYRLDDHYKDQQGVVIKCPNCQLRFKIGDPELKTEPQIIEKKVEGYAVGQKILVADDSPYFRTMVGDILEECGYQVALAGDGEEALTMLKDENPDLMILDLHLPKISGFEVIKEIRHGEFKKDVPILVISSVYTETSHVMTLDTIGANDFIDKKFKPAYLISRVKKLLENTPS